MGSLSLEEKLLNERFSRKFTILAIKHTFLHQNAHQLRAQKVTKLGENGYGQLTLSSKRSPIDCRVVFISLFLHCSLRQHTFAKRLQHQHMCNELIDKKVRDPLTISKSKTSTVFLTRKHFYQRKWGGVWGEGGINVNIILTSLTQEKRRMKRQPSGTRAWYDYHNDRIKIMFKNVLIKVLFKAVARIKHQILKGLF